MAPPLTVENTCSISAIVIRCPRDTNRGVPLGESTLRSLAKREHMFYSRFMEYRTLTDGTRRRVHREYVDVVARFGRDGSLEPVSVIWKDGRSFTIDEATEGGRLAPRRAGVGRPATTCDLAGTRRSSTSSAAVPSRRWASPMSCAGGSLPTTRRARARRGSSGAAAGADGRAAPQPPLALRSLRLPPFSNFLFA